MTHRAKSPDKEPTQVTRPWRSTARAVIIAGLALIPLLPEIAHAANIQTVPTVAAVLTITAAIQRVITLPTVDRWLNRALGLGAQRPRDYEIDRNSDES